MKLSQLIKLISCSLGEIPSDLLLLNGNFVNVITRELYKADVSIYGNWIANVSEPGLLNPKNAKRAIDITGKFISPGFIESHLHIESTMLSPNEFTKLAVPNGTTTALLDPHEIGNVLGIRGLKLLLSQVEGLPLRFLIEIPSCVPAAPNLETTAHNIDSNAIKELMNDDSRFFGLGEVMNYPGVLLKDEIVLAKVLLGKKLHIIDGHSPNLSGKNLDAYIAAGIESDHESTTADEFFEKIRKGMKVMVREGSLAKDLHNILEVVKNHELDLRNCSLCSDDRNVLDLYANGHMNAHARLAVKEGVDPILALQMITINPATYLGLQKEIGSIAPGKIADLVILENLEKFKVNTTIFEGKLIFHNNIFLEDLSSPIYPSWAIDTVKLPEGINSEKFRVKTKLADGIYPVRVIGVLSNSLITENLKIKLEIKNGWIYPLPEQDILSISVIERYNVNGNITNGFIKGFKINESSFAMATSVAHDSHNIIVSGTDHQTMMKTAEKLSQIKGGYVVSIKGQFYEVPLHYCGLMTTDSHQVIRNKLNELNNAFSKITDFKEPLMALSFMALPVIPHLKITDRGLVDVDKFTFTDIIIS